MTGPLFDSPTEIMKIRVARFEELEVQIAAFTLQQRVFELTRSSLV
jgi:hypothetical protein